MWTDKDIALAILFICMVLLAPATYKFAIVFFRYVFNKYISKEDVIVTHTKGGEIVSQYRVSRFSDGRILYSSVGSKAEADRHER